MNCTDFENVVVAMARDEVIDAAAQGEGLAHADTCARCARRLVSERMLSDTVASAIAVDAAKQAPPHVGRMLMGALRERKITGQRLCRIWIRRGVTGAIAAMLLIGTAMMLRKTTEPPAARGGVAASVDDDAAGATDTGDEVTTDFIPLDSDPAPAGRTSLVRVQLPRTALLAFGLPVNEDRLEDVVQAEYLVDENGLTRAVRFVE